MEFEKFISSLFPPDRYNQLWVDLRDMAIWALQDLRNSNQSNSMVIATTSLGQFSEEKEYCGQSKEHKD